MYKKLADLKTALQHEHKQIEREVNRLNAVIDRPEPRPFDELQAAERIRAAKTSDHLNGTDTAASIINAVAKERAAANAVFDETTTKKADALQMLPKKSAELVSIEAEIRGIGFKIDKLIQEAAKAKISQCRENYRHHATEALNALISFDALNAIVAGDTTTPKAQAVLAVKQIPAIGLENAEPWQLEAGGQRLLFLHENAFSTVNDRYIEIIEQIKGELYAK